MSAPDLQSQLKVVFLLSKERIPRAFNDNNLKLTLLSPITRRKKLVCKGEKLFFFVDMKEVAVEK
jgi:hypothetical protein